MFSGFADIKIYISGFNDTKITIFGNKKKRLLFLVLVTRFNTGYRFWFWQQDELKIWISDSGFDKIIIEIIYSGFGYIIIEIIYSGFGYII